MKMIKSLSFPALITMFLFMSSTVIGDAYQAPRNELGQPDLRGVWNFSSDIPLERPREFADKEFLTQEDVAALQARTDAVYESLNEFGVGGYNLFWIEHKGQGDNLRSSLLTYPKNGRMPKINPGVERAAGGLGPDIKGTHPVRFVVGGIGKNGPEDRGLSERCIVGFNSGPPFMPSMYNNNMQIFQTKSHVVLMTEMIHDARIVPLDGRPFPSSDIRQWSGVSRGYWDVDSLVVETRNFNDLTQSFSSAGTSYNKLLIERFTRTSNDTVEYRFTIEDPDTFADKITAIVPMSKVDGEIFEYACHEGNYGMFNILQGARVEEARAK
jgi:hypothetical protein